MSEVELKAYVDEHAANIVALLKQNSPSDDKKLEILERVDSLIRRIKARKETCPQLDWPETVPILEKIMEDL